jgi:hypothetical protein
MAAASASSTARVGAAGVAVLVSVALLSVAMLIVTDG